MRHPDLPGLLRGELTNAEATAAGRHLEECADCRGALAELAVGHAMLTRAARTVAGPAAHHPEELPTLPSLVGRRRGPRAHTVLVATAAVIVGVATGAAAVAVVDRPAEDAGRTATQMPTPTHTPTQTPAYESAELTAVAGSAAGEIQMVAEDARQIRMTIRTSDLPAAGAGRFYYAWLLDPDTNKMLPLGVVGPSGTATFEVDSSLLGAYSAVDVSLERNDGDPAHSVTSVLRGAYTADRWSPS